jgi:hypothetical protein
MGGEELLGRSICGRTTLSAVFVFLVGYLQRRGQVLGHMVQTAAVYKYIEQRTQTVNRPFVQ